MTESIDNDQTNEPALAPPGAMPLYRIESAGPYQLLVDSEGRQALVGDSGYAAAVLLALPEPTRFPDCLIRMMVEPLPLDEFLDLPDEAKEAGFGNTIAVSLCFRRVEHEAEIDPTMAVVRVASTMAFPGLRETGDTPPPTTPAVATVVEIYGLVPSLDDEELTSLIDRGLEAVRSVQSYYGAATGQALTPLTRQRCPMATVVHLFDPLSDPSERPEQGVLMVLNDRAVALTPDVPVLSADQLSAMQIFSEQAAEGAPFSVAGLLGLDGVRELENHGNRWASLSLLASAAEGYLDDLLGCLLWEEGCRPEDASTKFDATLVRRVKSGLYGERLDGDWDIDGDGPVGEWFRKIIEPRNRMLHAGRAPNDAAVGEAVTALHNLVEWIGERLVASGAAYPRTTWLFLGGNRTPDDFRRSFVDPLLDDTDEPHWKVVSSRWIRVMHAGTRFGAWRNPFVDRSDLRYVVVIHPDDRRDWVLVDEANDRARLLAEEPSEALSEKQLTTVAEFVPSDFPHSVALGRPMKSDNGPWIAAYRVLPLIPTLVVGDALDRYSE